MVFHDTCAVVLIMHLNCFFFIGRIWYDLQWKGQNWNARAGMSLSMFLYIWLNNFWYVAVVPNQYQVTDTSLSISFLFNSFCCWCSSSKLKTQSTSLIWTDLLSLVVMIQTPMPASLQNILGWLLTLFSVFGLVPCCAVLVSYNIIDRLDDLWILHWGCNPMFSRPYCWFSASSWPNRYYDF